MKGSAKFVSDVDGVGVGGGMGWGRHRSVPDPTLGSTLQFASVKAGIRGHGNWYCVCS